MTGGTCTASATTRMKRRQQLNLGVAAWSTSRCSSYFRRTRVISDLFVELPVVICPCNSCWLLHFGLVFFVLLVRSVGFSACTLSFGHVAGGQCALLACLLVFSKQFSFILGVSGVTGRENDRTQNARRGLLMCCET